MPNIKILIIWLFDFIWNLLLEHISPWVCIFSHFEFHQLKERPEGGFWIIWWFSSAGLPADGHGQIHWIQQGLCLTGRHYQFHLQPGHLGFWDKNIITLIKFFLRKSSKESQSCHFHLIYRGSVPYPLTKMACLLKWSESNSIIVVWNLVFLVLDKACVAKDLDFCKNKLYDSEI